MTTARITAPARFDGGIKDTNDLARIATLFGGRHRHLHDGLTEDEIRDDNNTRAAWGAIALLAFTARTFGDAAGEDWETLVGDLMADLMHLCDALGVDFDEMVEKGRSHYEPELHGEL